MAVLNEALDDAMSGHGRLVMLAGEPGIGKTRTAQELASYAEAQGARVLWGWCYEQVGAPPYWPWVQPIRSYVQNTDPDQLRSQMGPGAADIAEAIPEIRDKLPDLARPPALEPDQARFRLFDSFITFFKRAAQTQPLMLVLDDLHWADKDSLLLLEFLARQMEGSRLLVVGCYRDVELSRQHPLSETLSELAREPVFRRELLRGLSRDDTGRYIQAVIGQSPPRDLVDRIHAHTEGNPFFMTEVLRLLSDRGELITEQADGVQDISVPEGVREAIGQRLNRLSELCNQMLTTASVIGRQFNFRLLDAVIGGMTEEQGLAAIDEAVSARLIEEVPGGTERFQFSHALVQRTLADELTTTRRVRLHALVATSMEEQYGGDAEAHAAELAYHFAQAEPVLGPEKLVRYSLLAGERALAAYAWDEALVQFERGLAAKEEQHPMDAVTAALLFGLGRAQAATFERHQYHEALNNLTRAFDYYVEVGDVPRAVAIAEHPIPLVAGEAAERVQLLPRALGLVPPDSHEAARLMSRYTRPLVGAERASEALGRALTIARREGDIALEIRTLINTSRLVRSLYRHQESLEMSLQAIDLARRTNDLHSEVVACFWAVMAQSNVGDLEGMRLTAATGLQAAERLHDRSWLALSLWSSQMAAKLEGAWEAARDFGDRGMTVSPRECRILYIRILVEYEVGDFDQAEAYLEKLLDGMRQTSPGSNAEYSYVSCLIPMVACTTGKSGRLDVAEETAKAVLSSSDTDRFGEFPLFARTGLGLMAVLEGDAAAAREQYDALESLRGLMLVLGGMANDRLLGLLSQTMGNLDQAAVHFEDALAFCRKSGYRPELAWTCHDYADAVLQRNGDGDRSRAISLLDESIAISGELGMKPLMERVKGLQESSLAQQVREPAYPDGLSHREVEVLRLVAAGKSNPEIGRELFISSNTVANHVRNILNKTNTPNRIAAAGYAMQRGLTS